MESRRRLRREANWVGGKLAGKPNTIAPHRAPSGSMVSMVSMVGIVAAASDSAVLLARVVYDPSPPQAVFGPCFSTGSWGAAPMLSVLPAARRGRRRRPAAAGRTETWIMCRERIDKLSPALIFPGRSQRVNC